MTVFVTLSQPQKFRLNLNINVQTPVHTIASNAGVEGAVVVGKLLEQDNPDLGYDAAKGTPIYTLRVIMKKTLNSATFIL